MHALRIDDELWSAAMVKAKSEGRTLTQVINDSLAAYVAGAERIEIIPLEPKKIVRKPRASRAEIARAETVLAAADEARKRLALPSEPGYVRAMDEASAMATVAAARQRCPHPGTRVIGGYCKHCDAVVGSDGYLPG